MEKRDKTLEEHRKKLIYSCNWGSNPEKAWSGTNLGLFNELKNYYEIEKFDLRVCVPRLFLFRCFEKLGIGRFDMVYMRYYNWVFKTRFPGRKCYKVFQFDECPNEPNALSFLFLDLSAGFLLDVFENCTDMVPYCGMENLSIRYLKKRSKAQREFFKNTGAIFTMGKWLRDYLIEKEGVPADKVFAVGGGINVDIHHIDHLKKRGNKILFVGHDFKRKGGDIVIQAFCILKQQIQDLELYIVGPKKNPILKREMIEGIHFLGEQSHQQLTEIYNQCDIFCMPSRFEAYGLVFLEALAYGLPCVARNAFSMREIIHEGENGYLVDSDMPSELALKMELALHNQKMQTDVRAMKEYYVNEYSWASVVKRIVSVIEKTDWSKEERKEQWG